MGEYAAAISSSVSGIGTMSPDVARASVVVSFVFSSPALGHVPLNALRVEYPELA